MRSLRVRRRSVVYTLLYLKQHRPGYREVVIDRERLRMLPEDGDFFVQEVLAPEEVEVAAQAHDQLEDRVENGAHERVVVHGYPEAEPERGNRQGYGGDPGDDVGASVDDDANNASLMDITRLKLAEHTSELQA